MNTFTSSPFFGISLCVISFVAFSALQRKTKSSLLNPLLLATISIIAFLLLFDIPVDDFMAGSDIVALFLMPATACLAVSIYRQLHIVKQNLIPILAGCIAGAATSVGSIWALGKVLRLDDILLVSSLPKSSTTPIAVEVTEMIGGEPSITVLLVIATGIFGALIIPSLVKICRLRNPVATGIAAGSASHAIGTSAAVKLGETEGATSSIAITIAGISQFLIIVLMRFLNII